MDTPGHPNFIDEVAIGLWISDGALLVIDVIEGVTFHTEAIIKHLIWERMPIVVVLNKFDWLIIELKLPPEDAYLKMKWVLEKTNFIIKKYDFMNEYPQISPTIGNVIFATT